MESKRNTYASFQFKWTVKETLHQIRYRKAFDISKIDEVFCSIINAKGNEIEYNTFGVLLGFNLADLAEVDIFDSYLNELLPYKLIELDEEIIRLTEFGIEALQTKIKYQYIYATSTLFENQTATGEQHTFSFRKNFEIENELFQISKKDIPVSLDNDLKQRLQYQIFENDIYKGEITELYEDVPNIEYRQITLECETYPVNGTFNLSVFKSGDRKEDIRQLIQLSENENLKEELVRKGMYYHILAEKDIITKEDIESYIDLWDWKELAENDKVDWTDKDVFELFLKNGDGGIWDSISRFVPIDNIKIVIQDFKEYWNWEELSKRLDDVFIKDNISQFDWNFEEISYRGTEFVEELLKENNLSNSDWDWQYLSKTLSNVFIEEYIEEFPWDFYYITEGKREILKSLLTKGESNDEYSKILLSKNWNWTFISNKFTLKFLYSQISTLGAKVDWNIILDRFFNDEEILTKCLLNPNFKKALKEHIPENFVISHQSYLWSETLINFLDELKLIQWESKSYIDGIDTNVNIKWDRNIFLKYHHKIATEKGFSTVSQQITDHKLLEENSNFAWSWEDISQNEALITNPHFIKKAFIGEYSFSNKLNWGEILNLITNLDFINSNLERFYQITDAELHSGFWQSLTKREDKKYILNHIYYPWDWSYITSNTSEELILASLENDNIVHRWDWAIATRKFSKDSLLENIEDLTPYVDWKYLISDVLETDNELLLENQLPQIAACISTLAVENGKEIWKVLTSKYSFDQLFPLLETTYKIEVFEWDWDYISSHDMFPTDFGTLNQFKNNIKWTIFSNSKSVNRKFNFREWENYGEWFRNTNKYLSAYSYFWDWEVLSQNDNLTYNRNLLNIYQTKPWDWEYLSEFGGFLVKQNKDESNYLENVIRQFDSVRFDFLSKRSDIEIGKNLILKYQDENWDWEELSGKHNAELSNELLIELKDKNWNWQTLSKRNELELDNDTLLKLEGKAWDWEILSTNKHIEFTVEFITKTLSKPWDWNALSRHKTFKPIKEILTITKDFKIDWEYISAHPNLDPTKELLSKFEEKWNWYNITRNAKINFEDVDFLKRFKGNWDWQFICKNGKIALNSEVLYTFKEYLEWDLISSNTNIDFTEEVIQDYKEYWNWTSLKHNLRVKELLGDYVEEEINNSAILTFFDKIEQQYSPWKGSIYHFTHIDNAVEIIKNKKIQSRHKANIKGDAAGNVVHIRDDAHEYARFYFRPHTPTQFYNEFLGKNTTDGYESQGQWISWYERARGLGFPKCPIPIFFRFSLKETLYKNENLCCISNGNMQTSSTQFGSIKTMINKFGFENLYYTPEQYSTKEDYKRYRNYAQQEFLVKDELSFDNFLDFKIVCPSTEAKALLINLLGKEYQAIFANIIVDSAYYNNENPKIKIREVGTELHFSTDFEGDGYFVLSCSNVAEINVLSGDVSKMDNNSIIFKSFIKLDSTPKNLKLNFIDESSRNWFVYEKGFLNNHFKNKKSFGLWQKTVAESSRGYNPMQAIKILKQNGYNDVFTQKIRHYTLEGHTYLVCNVFEKHFAMYYDESISLELFRSLLILHDIGKSMAFIEGDKNNQYKHTKHIIEDLWKNLPYPQKDLSIILALLENDSLGAYFQGKLSTIEVSNKIYLLSESCDLTAKSFFRIYMVYYQCDTAAYTADAGGIKFLEHLFEYKNGKKVFDKEEGLLKLSPKFWNMYKKLKMEIENGN